METFKEFLVFPIDYKKKIGFLSTKDVKRSWSFEVDLDFPLNEAKLKMFLDGENEENVKSREGDKQLPELAMQLLTISEDHNLMSFTTTDKSVYLCKINESSIDVISRRLYSRSPSVLKFSSCGKLLFLSDKTGDIFEYSCEDINKPGQWIFGHLSQILDLQIKSDLSYIATSDRDEKIRITNYPDAHEIEAFCVGHKEYVSSVTFFDKERLLMSASGDKTLRFWNFKDGRQVQLINLPDVAINILLAEDSEQGFMAMSSEDNTIFIYSYQIVSPEITKIHLLGQKSYTNDYDFALVGKSFYVKHTEELDGKQKMMIDKILIKDNAATFEIYADANEALNITLDPAFKLYKPFDVSLMYKKKFDGCKQYIDRKKERIENQAAKKPRK